MKPARMNQKKKKTADVRGRSFERGRGEFTFLSRFRIHPAADGQLSAGSGKGPIARPGVVVLVALFALLMATGGAFSAEDPHQKAKALVSDLGCVVCHKIRDDSITTIRTEAPDLSYEGDKVRSEWLFGYLMEPYRISPLLKGRMPGFRISEEEAVAITRYLMTLTRGIAVAEGYPNPSSDPDHGSSSIENGKAIFERLGCVACHPAPAGIAPPDIPNRQVIAPDLTQAAVRLKPAWIAEWVRNPQGLKPGTLMPPLLAAGGEEVEQNVADLTEFILNLAADETSSDFAAAAERYPDATAEVGRELVKDLNCAGCHNVPGIEPVNSEVDLFAPPLTYVGSLVPERWIIKLLKKPMTVYSSYSRARMPDYRLSDEEVDLLKRYLLSLKMAPARVVMRVRRPGDKPIPKPDVKNPFEGDPVALAQGKQMFGRTCSHCHGYRGEGGNGPDLTDDYWKFGGTNIAVFRAIYAGRKQTLMAPFRGSIQANDIWRLMLFIRSQYKGNQKEG